MRSSLIKQFFFIGVIFLYSITAANAQTPALPTSTPVPTQTITTGCFQIGSGSQCNSGSCSPSTGAVCKISLGTDYRWCCPPSEDPPQFSPPETGCGLSSAICGLGACNFPNDKPICIEKVTNITHQLPSGRQYATKYTNAWCCPLPVKPPPEPGCVQIQNDCRSGLTLPSRIINPNARLYCPTDKRRCISQINGDFWCCPGAISDSPISSKYLPDFPGLTCGEAESSKLTSFDGSRCCETTNDAVNALKNFDDKDSPDFGCLYEGSDWCLSKGLKTAFNWVADGGFGPAKGALNLLFQYDITHEKKCYSGKPDPKTENDPEKCTCIVEEIKNPLCELYTKHNPKEYSECIKCFENTKGVWTAIGCIPTQYQRFIGETILNFILGLGGIISLICIIYAGIIMQTSRGDPEKIKKARDMLTSCIVGLIMVIFSIFILRVIGVDLLRIPGFGG